MSFQASASSLARVPVCGSESESVTSTQECTTTKHNYRKYIKPQWRAFASKSALLVLAWNMLCATTYSVFQPDATDDSAAVQVIPFIVWPFSAVVFGWLADVYLGHYRVAKLGMILIFLTSVLLSVLIIVKQTAGLEKNTTRALLIVIQTIGLGSTAMNPVILPQVGLEQMPDCSSSNITSFIAWFVFSYFAGFWVGDVIFHGVHLCVGWRYLTALSSLFPVVCIAIVLISDFFLTPKWLIIEPKSPQSLKTIYQVLKFAWKHKSPLNRSALTYWEEDIPSRLDLGKSRYGGPFTTEQVENVKTLIRILALTLPMWITLASFNMFLNNLEMFEYQLQFNGISNCTTNIIYIFTYDRTLWILVLVVVYELVIYPFLCHAVFTSVRRIGLVAFFVFIANGVSLVLSVYYLMTSNSVHLVVAYVHSVIVALLVILLLSSAMEFVCAQSPHNMRGLLLGYIWFIYVFSYMIAQALLFVLRDLHSTHRWSVILHTGLAALLGLIGFVLYFLLARWYKRRVRDDIATPHRWAEDAYDKYLSDERRYRSEQEQD